MVLGSRRVGGRTWMQVRIPGRPNGRRGWVPRDALGGLHKVHTALTINRRTLRAKLTRRGRVVWTSRVGVGAAGTPTPAGRFWIRERLRGFGGSYGPWAFGTSAYSNQLTGWPGGGVIGIHGTDQPGLIPGRPSHGCVRVPNAAIRPARQAHADGDAGADSLTVSRSPSSRRLRRTFLSNLPTLVFGTSSMYGEVLGDPPLRDARGEVLLELLGRGLVALLEHHAGERALGPALVGLGDHGRLGDRVVAPSARSRGRPRRSTRRRT